MSRLNTIILNQKEIRDVVGTNSGYIVRCMGLKTEFNFGTITTIIPHLRYTPFLLRHFRDSLHSKAWEKLDEQIN